MPGNLLDSIEREEYGLGGAAAKLIAKLSRKVSPSKEAKSRPSRPKKVVGTPSEQKEILERLRARAKEVGGAPGSIRSEKYVSESEMELLTDLQEAEDFLRISPDDAERLNAIVLDNLRDAWAGGKSTGKAEGGEVMERATYNIGGYGDGSSIFSPYKRQALQEGGALLMPPEQEEFPEDTYTPEDQANAEALQVPDEEMEGNFSDFILGESLEPEEQDYLMGALEADPRLSEIFDKVIETASEFTGEGEVEGPGTGVSDSIPARLSDGEFVITQKATDQIGANNLQSLMDEAERAFDGGLQRMEYAFGGVAGSEEEQLLEKEDPEIRKQMISANRMPSVYTR